MIVKFSGHRIAISPFFFREFRYPTLLKIRSRSAFHPAHVTTRLCLELLVEALSAGPCRMVLDVGCGTGILGLTAARLGAPMVVGLDTDLRAVAASRENAKSNGLMASTHWIKGSTAAVCGSFDCILANLPFAAIAGLLDDLWTLLGPSGNLVLSGFHDIDWYMIRERLLCKNAAVVKLLSGDQSFCGVPPSGSFTWMAALLHKTGESPYPAP